MTEAEKYKALQLKSQGYGYKKIAAMLGLSVSTIKSHISRSSQKDTTTYCENCGELIIQTPKKKYKRFCSDKCRMQWWSKHPELVNRTEVTHICAFCGKEFVAYGKKTKRKYCSRACYDKARNAAWEKVWIEKEERLERERVSCRTTLQDLPADCLCASCKWFVDNKRSCPCKEKTSENL